MPALALTVGHRKAQPETTTVQNFDFANCTLASPLDLALGDVALEDFDERRADDLHAAAIVKEKMHHAILEACGVVWSRARYVTPLLARLVRAIVEQHLALFPAQLGNV